MRGMKIKKFKPVLIGLLIVAFLITIGCTPSRSQFRDPITYNLIVYNDSQASPSFEQTILDFLAQDTTDHNIWIADVYECGYFAADVWLNAYMHGIKACMVQTTHQKWGMTQKHWLVCFFVEESMRAFCLWIDPKTDEVVDIAD